MAQFTIYKSTDASAPTLSGTAGDLVNLLDKCLVTGYGSKAAAGWTKPYTGTNKAAFKNAGGCQMYLRVQDDSPGAHGGREARVTGYETMSDVDTGTGPFPTAAQGVGGVAMLVWRKSATADATTRSWIVLADARTCYVFVITGDFAGLYFAYSFGEFYSLVPSDAYRNLIIGRVTEANTLSGNSTEMFPVTVTAITSTTGGHYIPRTYTGLGTSVLFGKHGDTVKSGGSILTGTLTYPNPDDGGAYFSPLWIGDNAGARLRGRIRGLWQFMHPAGSVNDADTISGVGDLSGKSFLFIKSLGSATLATMETSDTLETN